MQREIDSHDVVTDYITRHGDRLLEYARSLTRQLHDDADDLYQETIYKALVNRNMYRHRGRLEHWLMTIMHNIYINELNSAGHKYTISAEVEQLPIATYDTHDEHTIEQMYSAIDALSERERTIVIMRIKGHSYNEIAQCMNIKQGTIKSTLHRIKIHLRAKIKEMF